MGQNGLKLTHAGRFKAAKAQLARFLHWFTRPITRVEWIAVIVFGTLLVCGGKWWGLYYIGAGIILIWRKV